MAVSIAIKMVMVMMAIVMIQSVSSKCSGKAPNKAYSKQVAEVVSALQQKVAHSNTFTDTYTSMEGYVTGSGSCKSGKSDQNEKINDCLTCLGWAAAKLTTEKCKGKQSGSSTGNSYSGFDSTCEMSFRSAK